MRFSGLALGALILAACETAVPPPVPEAEPDKIIVTESAAEESRSEAEDFEEFAYEEEDAWATEEEPDFAMSTAEPEVEPSPAPVIVAPPPPPPPAPVIVAAPPPPPPAPVATPAPGAPRSAGSAAAMAAPSPTPIDNCEALLASGRTGFSCISVFYGTNRAKLDADDEPVLSRPRQRDVALDEGDLFSIRPDTRENCEPNPVDYSETPFSTQVCHLGEVVISVPDTRRKKLREGGGSFDSARSGESLSIQELRQFFALLDHISFDRDPDGFAARVHEVMASADPDAEHAFVFIHGFNVPFRNAAFRTAQLKYDMQIEGPVFFFSWPSNGNLLDYLSDQEDADLSADALARYLRLVHRTVSSGPRPVKVHIVAHSMGTRVAAQALAKIADFPGDTKFGHVVFAAGDLDSNLFEEWMGAAEPVYDGVTLYTSRTDAAVGFSGVLRNLSDNLKFWGSENDDEKLRIGFYQEGALPVAFQISDSTGRNIVKTIDVTAAAASSFMFQVKHTTYAESRAITDDIRCLFDHPTSDPMARNRQFVRQPASHRYWKYDPDLPKGTSICPMIRFD